MQRLLVFLVTYACLTSVAPAQNPGGGNQGGNQNQGNAGGILIDARGIVAPGFVADQSDRLNAKRQRAAAEKSLASDIMSASPCRKVSLIQLEAAVAARLAAEEPISPELACLAGLQRIDYLFVDPDGKDLIIAGPAEGFAPDQVGRPRGVESGRPTLLLDDLLVALRSVPKSSEVGCSIDPVPANLAALERYVAQNSTPATPQVIERRYKTMADVLGLHDVRVMGVPEDSHFARSLVEADYRMKRISIGLETPGVKGLRSHLAMLGPGGNSVQRWWFVPLYDGLYRSADRLAFELVGQRVQLLSQEELTNAAGERSAAATTRLTTQAFAKQFTERFADLADQSPVFAELQNLFDLCLLAALIDQEQLAGRVGWSMTIFGDPERLPHRPGPVPRQVPAIVNSKRASSGVIVGLVGGGVTIQLRNVLNPAALQESPTRRLDAVRTEHLGAARVPSHRWWWD